MNLLDSFDLSLKSRSQQAALQFGDEEYNFQGLEERSNRSAHQLERDGLRSGDRIAVYLTNCVELIDVYLAAVKLGVIFVPINVLYRGREIEHILRDAEPKAVVSSFDLKQYIQPALKSFDVLFYLAEDFHRTSKDFSEERPVCPAEGDSPAAIVYTSGTTGRSKGAILTHSNFAANTANLITCWQMDAHDRLLLALPLFHVHGLGNGLHTWLVAGYRMRLLKRFRKETIVEEFLRFRPTMFFGVPTMYERLLEVPQDAAEEIGRSVRLFVSGSAPLPARTLQRFQERYGHAILERYGMSETLMNMSNPYIGERRAGSVGKPLPGVSIRLVSASSGKLVPEGEVGEIYIKGPNVFPGYWRRPEETREAFTEDGFFRSGDLAVRSSDGYYTLTGRRTDLILCGGFNVYPREIEEFLQEQPEVREAAVVGMPDPVRGEAVLAYVVRTEGRRIDPETLCARCRDHLASFKVPKQVTFVDDLPRNALGKIQRHRLARPAADVRST